MLCYELTHCSDAGQVLNYEDELNLQRANALNGPQLFMKEQEGEGPRIAVFGRYVGEYVAECAGSQCGYLGLFISLD